MPPLEIVEPEKKTTITVTAADLSIFVELIEAANWPGKMLDTAHSLKTRVQKAIEGLSAA